MDHSIISRITMFQRGLAAYIKKHDRDEHDMNHDAAALPDWQAGWDAGQRAHADMHMAACRKVSPP